MKYKIIEIVTPNIYSVGNPSKLEYEIVETADFMYKVTKTVRRWWWPFPRTKTLRFNVATNIKTSGWCGVGGLDNLYAQHCTLDQAKAALKLQLFKEGKDLDPIERVVDESN